MKRILIVTGNVGIGGAQKALINFLKYIEPYCKIDLLLFRKAGKYLKDIPKSVNINYLFPEKKEYISKKRKDKSIIRKVKRKIYETILSPYYFEQKNKSLLLKPAYHKIVFKLKMKKNKYDTVIAFNHTREMLLVAFSNSKAEKIVIVHGDLMKHKSEFPRELEKKAYAKYDKILCVSEDSKESFLKLFPEMGHKVIVVNNLIDTEEIKIKADKISPSFNKSVLNIVVVARFAEAKGHKRLMKIHNKLIEEGYYYHLHLIGSGPLHNEIKEYVDENYLNETVHFWGALDNPYPFIKEADLILLPSVYEALPTVLYEALILNKSVLATDVGGVNQILEQGKYGAICENNEESLYQALKKFIENPSTIVSPYGYEYPNYDIINKYLEILGINKIRREEFDSQVVKLRFLSYEKPIYKLERISLERNILHLNGVFFFREIELPKKDIMKYSLEIISKEHIFEIEMSSQLRKDISLIYGNFGEKCYDYSGFEVKFDISTLRSGDYKLYLKILTDKNNILRYRISDKLNEHKIDNDSELRRTKKGHFYLRIR